MFEGVCEFLKRLKEDKPCFLSMSGPTETGKTFLLSETVRFVVSNYSYFGFDKLNPRKKLFFLPFEKAVSKILTEKETYFSTLGACRLLVMDDFLSEDFSFKNAYNSVNLEIAYKILNRRRDGFIMFDTNKSIDEINALDTRIASRMIRNDSIHIDIPANTTKFLSR